MKIRTLLLASLGLSGCYDWDSLSINYRDSGMLVDGSALKDGDIEDQSLDDIMNKEPDMIQQPDLTTYCYNNNFNDPNTINDFQGYNGTWKVENMALTEEAAGADAKLIYNKRSFKDFRLSVSMRLLDGSYIKYEDTRMGVVFRYDKDKKQGYLAEFYSPDGAVTGFNFRITDLAGSDIYNTLLKGDMRKSQNFELSFIGTRIVVKQNGQEIMQLDDMKYTEGLFGFTNAYGQYEYSALQVCDD